jgi:uncharacterized protein (UPF0276 family)
MHGVGIGFRTEIATETLALENSSVTFLELAPENWMQLGGKHRRLLDNAMQKFPITCHGLSLSLGSPEPLDWDFIKLVKQFLKEFSIELYSEHLSYCKCQNAHFYDLLPLPFTQEAITHVVSRIKQVQDFLERKIAIENVSYYCPISPEMQESEFLSRIVEESDCNLLLDVNNVYVNAFNHQYDPYEFLKKIPLNKVAYVHMAGHQKVNPTLIIDTHGHPIIDPVFELFEWTAERISPVPVLLERDFNFDDFEGLIDEVESLNKILNKHWLEKYVTA